MPEHVVRIERVINASANELYAAWTETPILTRWLAPTLEADVRVGGAFKLDLFPSDGGAKVITGKYDLLQQGHLIDMTFVSDAPGERTNERLVVQFYPQGSLTRLGVTLSWDGSPQDGPALQRAWKARLDRLCAGVELATTADLDR
ncbi:MAG: SRPBCC domain-containing protein [Kofleriaceae bacterium]